VNEKIRKYADFCARGDISQAERIMAAHTLYWLIKWEEEGKLKKNTLPVSENRSA